MPRRYYKPYKSNYRSYSNKKKWSPLMRDIPATSYPLGPTATDGSYITVVSNAPETATPTPTVLKAKHLKVSLDCLFDATVLNNGFCCLCFVPQGIIPTIGIPIVHPEWVMAWRNIPNDVGSSHHNIMLTTSMTRNLNSGDSIVILWSFYNSATGPTTVNFTGRYSGVVRNN